MTRNSIFTFTLISILCLWTAEVHAKEIELTLGQSKILTVDRPEKVAIGNPEIADITTVSDYELLINAKGPGRTTLVIWHKDGRKEVLNIVVSTRDLEQKMIEVQVEVLELSRVSTDEFGISWVTDARKGLTVTEGAVSRSGNPLRLGTFFRSRIMADIQALSSRGRVKILAQPRLLSLSGKKASFHSGGQIPILVSTRVEKGVSNVSHIQWKDYGVDLQVVPHADPLGNINIKLRAEVSSLDYINAVVQNDVRIPAIRNRWVEGEVYVKRGGTLVVAGLMDEIQEKSRKGIPLLSWIPLLGKLFSTTRIHSIHTELVIFVTPRVLGEE